MDLARTAPARNGHSGTGRTRCTPAQLFEIAVLDTGGENGTGQWHTIGWSVGRTDADAIAEAYVTRPIRPYDAARVRHNGRLLIEHHRPAG